MFFHQPHLLYNQFFVVCKIWLIKNIEIIISLSGDVEEVSRWGYEIYPMTS